jgi:drug/metabolite transporter (DMT)-like permease
MGGQMHFDFAKIHVMLYICAASIVSYCLWYTVVKDGELSKLFIIKFAEPVFACLFGAWIFGENILRWQYLVAFALICAGICLASVTKKKPEQTDA